MQFQKYTLDKYDLVCDFLININKEDNSHINWNWARLEWMIEHPFTDKGSLDSIGLWFDKDIVIAVAIYDMYFGEAFCATLPGYESIYPEVLDYAYKNLKDSDGGLGIAICDDNKKEIEMANSGGFLLENQSETMMSISLEKEFEISLPRGCQFIDLKLPKEVKELQWLIWQGFDHGNDREEFEKDYEEIKAERKHFNPYLNIVVEAPNNEKVGYTCLWYDKKADYAYIEPLCVIPSYRKKGIAKAMIYEGLNRARSLGAKKAYVLSDMEFYKNIGFNIEREFHFYYKREEMDVNQTTYRIYKLLGKGKGGYSYLAKHNDKEVVLKQIHHEPCDYYQFGNKIEAEINDYQRLINAGIRIPKMIDVDIQNERIVKEYIKGDSIFEMLANNEAVDVYIPQVKEMAKLAKDAGLNIDYYPTNFVVQDGLIYYVDYECNNYMEEWSFDSWGIKYWTRTPELEKQIENYKK